MILLPDVKSIEPVVTNLPEANPQIEYSLLLECSVAISSGLLMNSSFRSWTACFSAFSADIFAHFVDGNYISSRGFFFRGSTSVLNLSLSM